MSLQSGLYVGTSGLQTSQNALNTVAHNLSNIDTEGYTRQQIGLSDKIYNRLSKSAAVAPQQTGLGVTYSKVRQIRDFFLDRSYREEVGRLSFYEASYESIREVETILGEMNGAAFNESLSSLWSAVQEASKDPANSVIQGLIVQRASTFLQNASSVYTSLCDYQDNLNLHAQELVADINKYSGEIHSLNQEITKIEVGGTEAANDLRDRRNYYLDKLASIANISYTEDYYGSVSVKLEGVELTNHDYCYEIGMKLDPTTGFYTPFWKQNASSFVNDLGEREYDITGAEVFSFKEEIASEMDTDIGELKAVLLARGDRRANYTDLLDKEHYNDVIVDSVIVNVEAEFDHLVHSIVRKINDLLAESSDVASGYMCNADGSPVQLFEKLVTPGYEQTGTDASGNPIWTFIEEQDGSDGLHVDSSTLYTISNLKINQSLLQSPAKLGFVKQDGKVDYDTMNRIKAAFDEVAYCLNPNMVKFSNFADFYSDLVAQVGNDGAVFKSLYENQDITVTSTENARQQIVGVSSDEELSQMIRFQNAYNASSRFINVIDEMLEHLVSTLGA